MKTIQMMGVAAILAALTLAQPVAVGQTPAPAPATQQSAGAPTAPPRVRTLLYASADLLDVGAWVPAPPAPGSQVERDELAELHRIQDARTPAELDRAIADDKEEDIFVFASVFGPNFTAERLPQTAELGRQIRNDVDIVAGAAKTHFARLRPWAVDQTLQGCPFPPNKPPRTSYPSGHASSGYGLGVALASIVPEKAEAIMARAKDYGENRMVCGVHYRSDLGASDLIATVVVRDMMRDARFRAQLAAARTELQGAGIAAR